MKQYYPLKIPPGLYRNGTNYQASGRWYDANLMRWTDNTMRPVGGWLRLVATSIAEPGRGLFTWRPFDNSTQAAIGTPNKLWVYDGDTLTNITPLGLATGFTDTFYGTGYGSGAYGSGPYGGGSAGSKTDATQWSFDNWGEHLVAMASSDGKAYEYLLNPAVLPLAIAGAPEGRSLFVTAEFILVILGADANSRLVRWSDVQDNTQWTPDPTNFAGDLQVVSNGALLRGLQITGGSLLHTTTDVHLMTFIGQPSVYSIEQRGTACGLIGQNATVRHGNGAVWMSDVGRFFQFDGNSVSEIQCDVLDYVFGNITATQRAKIHAGKNSAWNEITWFYPSGSSTTVDKYVTWNYKDNIWYFGSLNRSAWADRDTFGYPMAVSENGFLYFQEYGQLANGATRVGTIFATTGPNELGNGDNVISVTQLLPDEATQGDVEVLLTTKFTPEGPTFTSAAKTLTPYTSVRETGRQIAVRFQTTTDNDFRIGTFRFQGSPRGKR